jgi:hypothetical protein
MGRPLDMSEIRRTIAAARDGDRAIYVTADFLEQVERELAAGRAAQAMLDGDVITAVVIDSIERRQRRVIPR